MVNDNESLRVGPPARRPTQLDDFASPYALGTAIRVPRPYIEMARGCLFQCTFCSDARASRGGFSEHSVSRISDDIRAVVAWPELEWVDAGASTANVTTEAFVGACNAIKGGDPKQRAVYSFQLYPSLVRQEQRDAMEGIRIGKLLIGLQSTSPQTFRPMKRGGTLDHLRRAIDILDGTGPLYISVILGLPGETRESFVQMFDELVTIPGITVSIHRLLVLPGTGMHTRYQQMGLTYDPHCFYRATSSSHMSNDDFVRVQEHIVAHAVEAKRQQRFGATQVDWTNFDDQINAFDPPLVDGERL
jgi:radical SAM superfamily enzyme YgiQ (UPF0313 family)